ncbi:MAG: polysaccharide biosynthesis tyrosine autokinase [Rhodobacteraceae bacterium]|nr:polysaccharide biosynthesis tyrosine autokinase [Paracoccaceae bacterium]
MDEDSVDLFAFFRMFWAGKWMVFGTILFCLTLGYFFALQQTPLYRATATVIFDLQRQSIADLGEAVTGATLSNATTDLQNQIEVLRSTALIERVIEKQNLARNPEFNPSTAEPDVSMFDWFTLPPEIDVFFKSIGLIQADPPPVDSVLQARRDRLAMINHVRDGLTLSPVRGASVIHISFRSPNPRTAADLANAIADQYIVDQLEGKLEATRSATQWLSDRVLELQDKVTDAEAAVADAESQLAQEAGQTLEITQAQLVELNGALGTAKARELQLDIQVARLRQALAEGTDVGAIPEFRDVALIEALREEESNQLSQQTTLLNSVGQNHPSARRLAGQIAETRRMIREEVTRVVEAYEVQLNVARDQVTVLAAQVRELEELALEQSASEIGLRNLERQAQASRLLYENFLGRLQETSQQETLQTADARVISQAEVPSFPTTSGKVVILGIGGLLGLLFGVGLVFLFDRMNQTLRTPDAVEDHTGLRVVATVPLIPNTGGKRQKVVDYFREKPASSLAEAIRGLRTSILFSNFDNPPSVVMFTSSTPREGKSTSAVLLALTSQQMGRSTIIVDCDLRLPAVSTLIEFDKDKPGLLAAMEGEVPLEEAVSVDPDSGLHVLQVRPNEARQGQNAADILASKKFQNFVESLRKRYDFVVLDTPPTLVVSDARIVSPFVDGVLFAIKWDETPRGAANEAVKQLRSMDAPIVGAVFTMVDESKAAKYSYDGYGYGYYGGQYKDYYVE